MQGHTPQPPPLNWSGTERQGPAVPYAPVPCEEPLPCTSPQKVQLSTLL